MSDAVLPLRRYFEIAGRSRRREYWRWLLFSTAVAFLLGFMDGVTGLGASFGALISDEEFVQAHFGLFGSIWVLATLVPHLTVSVRRLHDTDRSAWWLLVSLVPLLGQILFLAFMCIDGTRGDNRFGRDPKV